MERMYNTTATTRNPKWQVYTQASPRILHLPRRQVLRRKRGKPTTASCSRKDVRGKLEALFHQERSFHREEDDVPIVVINSSFEQTEVKRREIVKVEERESAAERDEKWRFQAQMLRAECNLLRIEKEMAVKKMERRRERMDRTLRSAVQTLISGKQKIAEGKNVSLDLEQEINYLVEKLQELQWRPKIKDLEVKSCSNFDKQASVLRKRLESFNEKSDENYIKVIREMAEASLSIKTNSQSCDSNMEILQRKMELLSEGVLIERMDNEYGSILATPSRSATSSTSSSSHIELSDKGKTCSRHCKEIARRIAEQVRADTEQWSQMQEMLGQVRDEMDELHTSRDFWEELALNSDSQIQPLRSAVQEWRQKALISESKAKKLEADVLILQGELDRLRMDSNTEEILKNLPTEMEKRVLIFRLKENRNAKDDRFRQKVAFGDRRRKIQTVCTREPLQELRCVPGNQNSFRQIGSN